MLTKEEIERIALSLCFPKGVPPPSQPISLEKLCDSIRRSYEQWYNNLPAAEKNRLERKKQREENKRRTKREVTAMRTALPKIERTLYENLIERCVAYEYGTCGAPINIISLKTDLTPYKIKEIISRLKLEKTSDTCPSRCSYKLIREWAKNYPKAGTSIAERNLLKMLDKHFPKQWGYIGDRKMYIGGLCPDFINGRKKLIIELFGDWHHFGLPKRSNPTLTKERAEQKRIKYFEKYGYHTLVIWASELKNEERVAQKVKNFMEDSHVARPTD